jgi:Phasin protein.
MAARKDERDTIGQVAEAADEPMAEADRQAADPGRHTRHATESVSDSALNAGTRLAEQGAEAGRRQTDQVRALLGSGTRLYSDLNEVSKDDVDTAVRSGTRLARGMQDMSWEVMRYTQQSLQLGLRTANELMICRTVDDLLNVQRNFMRASIDTFLQESAKLLEMSGGVATDAAAPIQQRPERGGEFKAGETRN